MTVWDVVLVCQLLPLGTGSHPAFSGLSAPSYPAPAPPNRVVSSKLTAVWFSPLRGGGCGCVDALCQAQELLIPIC